MGIYGPALTIFSHRVTTSPRNCTSTGISGYLRLTQLPFIDAAPDAQIAKFESMTCNRILWVCSISCRPVSSCVAGKVSLHPQFVGCFVLITEVGGQYGFAPEILLIAILPLLRNCTSPADPKGLLLRSIEQGRARYAETLKISSPLIAKPEDVWAWWPTLLQILLPKSKWSRAREL